MKGFKDKVMEGRRRQSISSGELGQCCPDSVHWLTANVINNTHKIKKLNVSDA